jgi:hypothetical protein
MICRGLLNIFKNTKNNINDTILMYALHTIYYTLSYINIEIAPLLLLYVHMHILNTY